MIANHVFNVLEHGADRTGARLATVAFQAALDACGKAGGGMVLVPPGEYLLGRIHLRDHVTFHLSAGAVLRPSRDQRDFPAVAGHPDSSYRGSVERVTHQRYSLLHGYGLRGVTIEGRGRIEGDGEAFWTPKEETELQLWRSCLPHHYYCANLFRPMLLLFERCQNLVIRDLTLADAPVYAGWFLSCQGLRITGTQIDNNLAGPNTDGYHFSSCRNVHLTDCDFVCGDDCIAIDGNDDGPSRDYTITGCTFNTTVNVFRLYNGLDPGIDNPSPGTVSDIVATGCTVTDASGVFNLTADVGEIERVIGSEWTITMAQRGAPIWLMTRRGGRITDVSLSNLTIQTDGLGTVSGEDGGDIRRIELRNLRYKAVPRTKLYGNGLPDPMPGYGIAHYAPYNFYFRHADDITLRDIVVHWGEADLADLERVDGGQARWPGIEARDVANLRLDNVDCPGYGGAEAVRRSD